VSTCGRKRTGKTPIPFDCKYPTSHNGRCSPYTLAPTTRAVGPAGDAHTRWQRARARDDEPAPGPPG
jgi:hypothetical protein